MTTTAGRTRSRYVPAVLIGFGLYSVALGLFMLLAPSTFHDTLGAFGPYNEHFVLDVASFELPLGALLLAALRWPLWRVPALAFAVAHWALHAANHVLDPHHAIGEVVGWIEAAGLVLGTALLAVALMSGVREVTRTRAT